MTQRKTIWMAVGLFLLYCLLVAIWILSMDACSWECKDALPKKGYFINLRAFNSVVEWRQGRELREYKVVTKCGKTYFLMIDNEGKLQEIWDHP